MQPRVQVRFIPLDTYLLILIRASELLFPLIENYKNLDYLNDVVPPVSCVCSIDISTYNSIVSLVYYKREREREKEIITKIVKEKKPIKFAGMETAFGLSN